MSLKSFASLLCPYDTHSLACSLTIALVFVLPRMPSETTAILRETQEGQKWASMGYLFEGSYLVLTLLPSLSLKQVLPEAS